MGQPQQEMRRAAVEAFKQSLDQLQQALEATSEPLTPLPPDPPEHPHETNPNLPTGFDLNVWEEAIADIEQFIQQRQVEQG